MPLSWNEITKRAVEFSKEWKGETRERAEAQSFWNDFFNIFGISRRRIATYEEPVKKLGDKRGSIDLLWKGKLIVEHKSGGKNLDSAYLQGLDYFPGLKDWELPKYVIVSDFSKFRIYNLDDGTSTEFVLVALAEHIHLFDFISGYTKKQYKSEDPVNIKAALL